MKKEKNQWQIIYSNSNPDLSQIERSRESTQPIGIFNIADESLINFIRTDGFSINQGAHSVEFFADAPLGSQRSLIRVRVKYYYKNKVGTIEKI